MRAQTPGKLDETGLVGDAEQRVFYDRHIDKR
jgi:hypothetical protein